MEESSCYYSIFIAICLFSPEIRELKIPHQVNKNWHWTNIHKVMKHVKNLISLDLNSHHPVTSSTNCLDAPASDFNKRSNQENPGSILESHMLLKQENSPDGAVGSPGFIIDQPPSQTALQSIDTDYNSNSFNFLMILETFLSNCLHRDGSFSLSPQQSVDMKDLEKADATSVILSSQPLSNSSLSTGSNASPKSFMAVGINEAKSDKMISGFDGRMDGLSPLSVIAVSAYQDTGHPSPSVPSSILSRTHVLRFHPSGDTMLSALNYNDFGYATRRWI
ncbi:zinc finger protein 541 [Caerostris extrusa]|uniref:Zinc finger protein 541 n=1 Tax=Caerostris extrusa TaxID=172846 RepID=A0AAV4QCM8_CAEEX|nr:zinc finger protein 541 [Caerostris extrusa]